MAILTTLDALDVILMS